MRRVLLLLLIAPLAAAGSADDPEVTDGSGDSVSSRPGLGAVGAELLKAWYEEDGSDVVFKFEVGTLCADTAETIEYRWFATVADAEVAFGADLFGTGGFCTLAGSATSITETGAATSAAMDGNIAVLTVPKSAFGDGSDGTVLSGTYGTSRAFVGSATVWNDADRAPDEGGGRDYVLGGPLPEPEPDVPGAIMEWQDVIAPELNVSEAFDGTPRTLTINWTHDAGNYSVISEQDGTGNVTISVNGTSCPCNETVASAGGTWNITLSAEDFVGNITLAIVPVQEVVETPQPTTQPTNETTDAPMDEESPLPLLVIPALLVVAARRRR